MPRIAQVLTSTRSSQSSRSTAPRSRPSTRAHTVSSAEEATCAWTPHRRATTARRSPAGAREANPWRAVRQASTASQVNRTIAPGG